MRAKMAWRQIRGDALPHLEALRARRGGGVDAEQVHAAQDEWHDRGLEVRATREPNACDVPQKSTWRVRPASTSPPTLSMAPRITRGLERLCCRAEKSPRSTNLAGA